MAHFAQIDENNRVVNVIVAEQNFIDSGAVGDPSRWIQTSYNTRKGVHLQGGTPLRKNYAGIGMIYDAGRDAFMSPHPNDGTTYILNEFTCCWERPIPEPEPVVGKFWHWDEATLNYVLKDTLF